MKYSKIINNLLKEIPKLLPLHITLIRMLDLGAFGSHKATILEVIGEVEFVLFFQAIVGLKRPAKAAKPYEPVGF